MGGSAIERRTAKGLAPPGLPARSAACTTGCTGQGECVQLQVHGRVL